MTGSNAHGEANRRADQLDRKWFRANPARRHRVRPSMPFEIEGWHVASHLKERFVIVRQTQDGWIKFAFSAHHMPSDEEVTLEAIFDWRMALAAEGPLPKGGIELDATSAALLDARIAFHRGFLGETSDDRRPT